MPANPAGVGVGDLILVERVQMLATEFVIRTNRHEIFERLGFLLQRSEQDYPIQERCTIDVTWIGEQYRIRGAGFDDAFEPSLNRAYDLLFARLHDRAMAALPDHIRLHAASGRRNGRLFLMTGSKRAGKTTLAMHLLLQGFDIAGDELVLLRQGVAVTFPRKFYLRHTALGLLPQLSRAAHSAPFVSSPADGRLFALDPTTLGRPWRIAPGEVATVIYVEPNHGSTSSLTKCGKVEMLQRVLPQSTPPASRRPDWLADLCGTVNRAETATLKIGDLASATVAIENLLR